MQDRLIFPTRLEQIATGELIHNDFPAAKWDVLPDETPFGEDFSHIYAADIDLDVSPYLFVDWAYRTIGGGGCGILFYCVNLSVQLLIEPPDWMLDIVTRANLRQLSDGRP